MTTYEMHGKLHQVNNHPEIAWEQINKDFPMTEEYILIEAFENAALKRAAAQKPLGEEWVKFAMKLRHEQSLTEQSTIAFIHSLHCL